MTTENQAPEGEELSAANLTELKMLRARVRAQRDELASYKQQDEWQAKRFGREYEVYRDEVRVAANYTLQDAQAFAAELYARGGTVEVFERTRRRISWANKDGYAASVKQAEARAAQCAAEGDEREALERLTKAVEYELDPDWGCESYHPSLAPALKHARAVLDTKPNVQPKGMRQSFEAWYSRRYGYDFGQATQDTWKHAAMCDAWEVWQAAAQAHAPADEPIAMVVDGFVNGAPKLIWYIEYPGRSNLPKIGDKLYTRPAPSAQALAPAPDAKPVAWLDPLMLEFGGQYMAHGNHPRYTMPVYAGPAPAVGAVSSRAAHALVRCEVACERIVEQYGGVQCGVDFSALLALVRRGLTEEPQRLPEAALDVLAERQRQISAEGWTPEHDDEHDDGCLARAAASYALMAASRASNHPGIVQMLTQMAAQAWPWEPAWFKPSTSSRDLVKAGALVLAERERMDRAGGEA